MGGSTNYYSAMILVQLIYGGSNVLMKLSLQEGLNQIVFVVYRHVLAMVLVGPFAYVLERKQRPSLSFSIAAKIFALASLGTTIHLNLYYAGLAYTSATVGCALSNVIPALTFLVAVLLRMEKLNIRSTRGQAKVVGTLLCLGGSLIFTFWKGGYLYKGFFEKPLIHGFNAESVGKIRHVKENWIKGSVLILTSYTAWSAWLILQAVISKVYPAPLSLTTMVCFSASLQSSFLALFFARNPSSWKLEWNLELLTIVYFGVLTTALVYCLQTWCISHKGPVFSAMFSPLQAVIVAVFSAIAFAERLHFGSLIGALLIIAGLYSVLWGKRKDSLVAEHAEIGKMTIDDNKVVESSMNEISVTNPLVYGGSNVVIKLSLQKGLHPIVSMVYGHVLPMVFVGPFAYVLERKQRPLLLFLIAAKISVLASIGTTIHLNVYYAGLVYTSPTVACALSNVIPALTFLTAVLLGMEKLKIRSARGQVKVDGTLFCIGGSLVFTFGKDTYLKVSLRSH
ncbi:hypothetical protein TB1_014288 [Malus domestica]